VAIEQLDLSAYDVIVSSSHAVAKGVLTGPDQLHVCYCHSPIRYAWDLQHEYLRQTGLARGVRGGLARYLLHRMRAWDLGTANGVDHFVANSSFVARRIQKVYRRDATVIHPPVDVDAFTPGGPRGAHYVTASRFVPYKRVDLIVEAFAAMPDRELVVIGDGPEAERIRARAAPNVRLLGHQPFDVLHQQLRSARAFVFAAVEDFGIVPLEAQATGTPVIAYARGGAAETIRGLDHARPSGVLYDEQSAEGIVRAVRAFEAASASVTAESCRDNAERFSADRFRREFGAFVDARCVERFGRRLLGSADPLENGEPRMRTDRPG
jgi:glycosyltransferase involved in cell wall biosynthesis